MAVGVKELKREAKVLNVTEHSDLLFKMVAAEEGSGLDEEVC